MSLEALEERIDALERRRREIDSSLADPKVAADAARLRTLMQERERLQDELEPLEEEWSSRAG